MWGVAELAGIDIAADPEEATAAVPNLTLKLLRDEDVDIIFIVQAFTRGIGDAGPDLDDDGDIASLAIAEESNENAAAIAGGFLFLADADWCGRPDEIGAAHREADPRLISPGSIEIRVPYLPELGRRATTQIATIEVSNVDGYFDAFQYANSINGQSVRVFMAEDWGRLDEAILLVDTRGRSLVADAEKCVIKIESSASRLDIPFNNVTFTGTTGTGGDPQLAGVRIPVTLGDPPNIEPRLESIADQVYRVNVGAVSDIPVVRDSGAASFVWDGLDFDNLAAFKAHVTSPGFYTKATKFGRFKLGNQPAGVVTCDVVGLTNSTRQILAALAQRLSSALVNFGSFGVIPEDPIGFYADGSTAYLVSDIYDALLRPYNCFYGDGPDGRLAIGRILKPGTDPAIWGFDDDDHIADPEIEEFDEPPRWRQGVTWGRNWRPMQPGELVDVGPGLDTATWQRLQRDQETYYAEDGTVLLRHQGAIEGPVIQGYFTTEQGARAAADPLLALLKSSLQKQRHRTKMQGIFAPVGSTGQIDSERLDLTGGRGAIVVGRSIITEAEEVEILSLVAMN